MRLYSIKGKSVNLLTIRDVSALSGFKSKTLRSWERKGILPRATVTDKMFSPLFGECRRRLYTEGQIKAFMAWLDIVRPGKGVSITQNMSELLHLKWKEETEKFLAYLEGTNEKA